MFKLRERANAAWEVRVGCPRSKFKVLHRKPRGRRSAPVPCQRQGDSLTNGSIGSMTQQTCPAALKSSSFGEDECTRQDDVAKPQLVHVLLTTTQKKVVVLNCFCLFFSFGSWRTKLRNNNKTKKYISTTGWNISTPCITHTRLALKKKQKVNHYWRS